MDFAQHLANDYPYAQKFYLESMLQRDPDNRGLLEAYLAALSALAQSSFGVFHAEIPGFAPGMFFRGGTADVDQLRHVFLDRRYECNFPLRPRRILDLGAYTGYAAVFLARQYPEAEIVCVEPLAANFRLLAMNTLAYANIRRVRGWPWHRAAMAEIGKSPDDSKVPIYAPADLMRLAGWSGVDYLRCDIEGTEADLLASAEVQDWLEFVPLVSIETHERLRAGSTRVVETAFPPDRYEVQRSGGSLDYIRLGAGAAEGEEAECQPILLAPGSLRPLRFALRNVPAARWGFASIDGDTFQLHPNPPGQPRAEVAFALDLTGQGRFSTQCRVNRESASPVIFSVCMVKDGRSAFEETRLVPPGQSVPFDIDIPRRTGPCQLILGTAMPPEAEGNGFAWARWVRPLLSQ